MLVSHTRYRDTRSKSYRMYGYFILNSFWKSLKSEKFRSKDARRIGWSREEGFRHALLGNGIATPSPPNPRLIYGLVIAHYNGGAVLRKPVTCSALPRTPPPLSDPARVHVHPPSRDGIIVTCSGEPRTRSSPPTNNRLLSPTFPRFSLSLFSSIPLLFSPSF